MPSTGSLRLALRANAAFSAISALTLFLAHAEIGRAMGVPPLWLIGVGLGLAIFAIQLVVTAGRTDLAKLRAEALAHSCADLAWVAASGVVVAGGWLTATGDRLLVAVGVPVLALGIAQLRSLPKKDGVARPESS